MSAARPEYGWSPLLLVGVPLVLNRVPVFASYRAKFHAESAEMRVIFQVRHLGGLAAEFAGFEVLRLCRFCLQFGDPGLQGLDALGHFFQRRPNRCFVEDLQNV